MGKLTSEDLERHLKGVVDSSVFAQISPEALKVGYEGMANALNQPQQLSNARETGYSR